MEKEFVCPLPMKWHEIHKRLLSFWEVELKQSVTKPPTPLILAGWNFSEDWEKRSRWNETLEWAKKNNCEHLIQQIAPDQKYFG
jgi:hypothetical protein